MGRFHFNIRNGTGDTPDEEGRELAGLPEAEAVAVDGARALLSEEVRAGDPDLRGCIEVTDDDGHIVFTIAFKDVLNIRTGDLPMAAKPANRAG